MYNLVDQKAVVGMVSDIKSSWDKVTTVLFMHSNSVHLPWATPTGGGGENRLDWWTKKFNLCLPTTDSLSRNPFGGVVCKYK